MASIDRRLGSAGTLQGSSVSEGALVSQGMHVVLLGNSGLVQPVAGERHVLRTFNPSWASPTGSLWGILKGGTSLRIGPP